MNTISGDTLRVHIFEELVKLDSEKLHQVYGFIKKLTSNDEMEVAVLKELLNSSADYAIQAYQRGDYQSTDEVMDALGKEMGWM